MLPDSRIGCCLYLATLRQYAASGIQHIMEFAKDMQTVNDTLPDDLKPTGELLTKMSIEALTEFYAESLRVFSELGLQEITRAALPPNHQTEKE